MTIEDQIAALLAKAEPLRCLPDDEPARVPLTAIVDEINALRAVQAGVPPTEAEVRKHIREYVENNAEAIANERAAKSAAALTRRLEDAEAEAASLREEVAKQPEAPKLKRPYHRKVPA